MNDKDFLERTVLFASGSPEDVKCACLLVRGETVITAQYNSQNHDQMAINHAEIKALVAANYERKSRELKGITAYCSCEPCAMCLTALSYAKIERIVYAHSMAELFPADKQAKFDSQKFVRSLNFIPKLEQITL